MGIYNEVKSVRRRKMYDPAICSLCGAGCSNPPCYPLTWIDGDKPRKEKLLNDPYDEELYGPDYNAILSDLSGKADPPDRLSEILKIRNIRHRIICLCIAGDVPVDDIASFSKQSRSNVYKVIDIIKAKIK